MRVRTICFMLLAIPTACCLDFRALAAEPAEAAPQDPDFAVQGEYVGKMKSADGEQKLGAQVIALDKGKFRAVLSEGGLPGDGWSRGERRQCDGERVAERTTFRDGDATLVIEAGILKISRDGKTVGELPKVTRRSPTLGAKPPAGAVVLFDGRSAEGFSGGRMTDDGLLMQGATSQRKFQSGTLHLEFRIPYDPMEPSRGNSGVYLQSRYEVQILNSFGFEPHNHECGGIPSIKAADVIMNFPPLAWQTYDVDFIAAKYEGDKKLANARMTVRHNGVVIHNDVEMPHVTTSAPLADGPEPGPLDLQEHGSQVRFRNIWFAEK